MRGLREREPLLDMVGDMAPCSSGGNGGPSSVMHGSTSDVHSTTLVGGRGVADFGLKMRATAKTQWMMFASVES